MIKYLYILVILYNLNIILNFYVEVMIKSITMFNYKNATQYLNNFAFLDILLYSNTDKNKLVKNLIKISQYAQGK